MRARARSAGRCGAVKAAARPEVDDDKRDTPVGKRRE